MVKSQDGTGHKSLPNGLLPDRSKAGYRWKTQAGPSLPAGKYWSSPHFDLTKMVDKLAGDQPPESANPVPVLPGGLASEC